MSTPATPPPPPAVRRIARLIINTVGRAGSAPKGPNQAPRVRAEIARDLRQAGRSQMIALIFTILALAACVLAILGVLPRVVIFGSLAASAGAICVFVQKARAASALTTLGCMLDSLSDDSAESFLQAFSSHVAGR